MNPSRTTRIAKGTYVLLFEIKPPIANRLGNFSGRYCYVGSAFGPGGVQSRVSRHLRSIKPVKWHIDLLTAQASFKALGIYFTPERMECILAEKLSTSFEGQPGFGASDCGCPTHLFRVDDLKALEVAMKELGLRKLDLDLFGSKT